MGHSTKGNRFPDNLVKKPTDIRTNEEQLLNAPYGQQGAVLLCETSPIKGNLQGQVRGDFYCIIAIRDDVMLQAGHTEVNWDENPDGVVVGQGAGAQPNTWTEDFMMPVGLPFYGNFTAVSLKTVVGEVAGAPKLIAYYK